MTRFRQVSWQQEIGEFKYMRQIRFGRFFVICILQLIFQWIDLLLGGRRRGFLPSSSISFSIIRFSVILYLYSSSVLFYLSFYCRYLMNMAQNSFIVLFACIYSYSTLNLSQSKNNRIVTFNWGSKQALVYSYKFELSAPITL